MSYRLVESQVYTQCNYPAVPYTPDNFHAPCVWDQTFVLSLFCSEVRFIDPKITLIEMRPPFETALTTKPYITQEIWAGSTSPVQPDQYISNGDVLGFSATEAMNTAFLDGGGLGALLDWPESGPGWVASDQMNTRRVRNLFTSVLSLRFCRV